MPIELTREQTQAVEKKGNILVAAAAGSGKTAVLVERIIKKLCSKTDAVSADRLLIVTFTNAAAAEMRGRIEKRLDEECRLHPEDTGLLMQKHLLASAKICTIDSFCIDLVRENFEKVGVSPDFVVSDGFELKSINERVISEIVRRYLNEENPVFIELLDIIGAEYDEKSFCKFVLDIYEYSRQMPFPKRWYGSLLNYYSNGNFTDTNPWRLYALEVAKKTVCGLQKSLAKATDLVTAHPKTADIWLPCFIRVSEQLDNLKSCAEKNDWDGVTDTIQKVNVPSLPRANGVNGIWEITVCKEIYANIKKALTDRLAKLFYANTTFINSQFKKIYEPLKLLCDILNEFDDSVFEAYKEENKFTFHNTEHLALNFLCAEKDGIVNVNKGAEEFLDRYEEVCVDEYQDTNNLQNMLFYVLSDRDRKLFAVGDVKQSIYGFRGANPNYFLEKKNSHVLVDFADENQPKKIILGNNFRCKPDVCEFANYFFSLFMNKETGDIEYNGEEKLIASAKYPETELSAVSMDIIDSQGDETDNLIIEARSIADYIRKIMNSGKVIRVDENNLREAKYSDFTILMRSMKNKASVIAAELSRQGIPANYNVEGFTEFTEIAIMLSLLKVVDNPNSDVELLAVMMSPLFGFTAEEMACIKIENKEKNLYSSVVKSAADGYKKSKNFLETIQKFRLFAVTNTLPKFMDILLEQTGLIDTVSVYSDGSRRKNNLLLLCEYAKKYSASTNVSISGFVRYILKQSESGIKSAVSDSGEDTVRIMSIHASKGLQFPVCIVAGTSTNFYISETGERNIYKTDFGIGFKYFDERDKKPYTTIGREAILDRVKRTQLQEELRLLYVAMTRTQDFLHFTANVSNPSKKQAAVNTWLLENNCEINENLLNKTSSYFDWLLVSLMLHPDGKDLRGNGTNIICKSTDSKIKLNIISSAHISDLSFKNTETQAVCNNDFYLAIKENMEYKYPFEDLFKVESKASVSSIANKAESDKYAFTTLPSFMSKGGITAAEKGTAMHKVMEFFDFSKWDSIDEELERLYEWQFLSEREYESVNREALERFFQSDIFKRILKADTVKREMRFLTELPASRIDNTLDEKFSDEKIIVQGAVDVCFLEEDGVVILDFKTDRTDNEEDLKNSYGEQLRIYAAACEKIFEKPVKQMKIYSFFQSKEIDV